MSHLGPRLSALIDGELGGAERDRVLAHVARCEGCRREAAALRALKQRMHSLGEAMADTALTGRLMAMAASGEARDAHPGWRPRAVYAAAAGWPPGWSPRPWPAWARPPSSSAASSRIRGRRSPPRWTPSWSSTASSPATCRPPRPVPPRPAPGRPARGCPARNARGPGRPTGRTAGTAVPGAGPGASVAGPAVPAGASATPSLTHAPSPAQRVTERAALLWPARRGAAALVAAAASPGP